jgi:hypothetical protein
MRLFGYEVRPVTRRQWLAHIKGIPPNTSCRAKTATSEGLALREEGFWLNDTANTFLGGIITSHGFVQLYIPISQGWIDTRPIPETVSYGPHTGSLGQ